MNFCPYEILPPRERNLNELSRSCRTIKMSNLEILIETQIDDDVSGQTQ